jgi:hypothetical protein
MNLDGTMGEKGVALFNVVRLLVLSRFKNKCTIQEEVEGKKSRCKAQKPTVAQEKPKSEETEGEDEPGTETHILASYVNIL